MTHDPTSDATSPTTTTSPSDASGRALTALLGLGGAAVVFVVCSIIQAAGGSSMFSTSFVAPDNAILEIAMQVTWWPGWALTAFLALGGIVGAVKGD